MILFKKKPISSHTSLDWQEDSFLTPKTDPAHHKEYYLPATSKQLLLGAKGFRKAQVRLNIQVGIQEPISFPLPENNQWKD